MSRPREEAPSPSHPQPQNIQFTPEDGRPYNPREISPPASYPPGNYNTLQPPFQPTPQPQAPNPSPYPPNNAAYPPQPVQYPPNGPKPEFPNPTGYGPQPVSYPPPNPSTAVPQQYPSPPASPYKPLQHDEVAQGIPVQPQFQQAQVPQPSRPNADTVLWSTGIFDCMDDPMNALVTACFPCVTFGEIAEIVEEGEESTCPCAITYGMIAFFIGIPCLLSCYYRTKLRSKYGLVEDPAPDWITHFFCEWCPHVRSTENSKQEASTLT